MAQGEKAAQAIALTVEDTLHQLDRVFTWWEWVRVFRKDLSEKNGRRAWLKFRAAMRAHGFSFTETTDVDGSISVRLDVVACRVRCLAILGDPLVVRARRRKIRSAPKKQCTFRLTDGTRCVQQGECQHDR